MEALTLEAILEALRHRPEGQDVAVWGDDTVVAVLRPDGTLIEVPRTGRLAWAFARAEPAMPPLSRRDVLAGLVAAGLSAAVALSAVAFDAEEIARQALAVADVLIRGLEAA
jgi:hypothetical protein